MLSRLLYTNPVCMLTTNDGQKKNIMTISWLTTANNNVITVKSIYSNISARAWSFCQWKNLVTLRLYLKDAKSLVNFIINITFVHLPFCQVLSVPVKGNEEMVLNIGKHTGHKTDKFKELNIPLCKPGKVVW